MNKKVKIIHLLCHLPHQSIKNIKEPEVYFNSGVSGEFIKISHKPYWVGFFTKDHHVNAAEELRNATDEYEIECWRPYGYGIKKPYSKFVNGILHRVFPAKQIIIPKLGKYLWSGSLYKQLVYEIKHNNVILVVFVGHAWFHIILQLKLRRIKKSFGLIDIHLSSGFKKLAHQKLSPVKKFIKFYYLIEHYLDIKSIGVSDIYYSGSQIEAKYLQEKHPELHSEYFMGGIDFSQYRILSSVEKNKLRNELGLPTDKNLFIVHGNWRSNDYSYEPLIECYKRIKENGKADNLQMVMIGGHKSEDLYQKAIEANIIMIERCTKDRFIKYLEAGDFFGKPNLNYAFINFGGFGFSTIEALACGLPILTNNIIHFPGNDLEREKIGLDMPTETQMEEGIIKLNNSFKHYCECRSIAEKHFNINKTNTVLINKFKELEGKYFQK